MEPYSYTLDDKDLEGINRLLEACRTIAVGFEITYDESCDEWLIWIQSAAEEERAEFKHHSRLTDALARAIDHVESFEARFTR